jgi:type 1 glutamine amidotransferase
MRSQSLYAGLAALGALFMVVAQNPAPARKKLLAIGEVKGYQHDSVSHALATIERLGRESGLYDTYIRTDTQLVTKQNITGPNGRNINAKNLNYFDAVLFYTTGELDMNDQQKQDLLSFVHDDGKGFIGVHSAIDTFYKWPEYGEMVGGYFHEHPWGTFDAPVIVERPDFPAMKPFPKTFTIHDEIYQVMSPYSRDKVDVLARLDASKLDLSNPRVHRTDKDFPVAWAKMYGKGRVFYSTLGHPVEVWDRNDVPRMYFEAIKWAVGLTPAAVAPHPPQ